MTGKNRNRSKKKASRGGTPLRWVLAVAAGLILGVNVYLANARGLAGNQMPMPFGFGAAVVLSGSMEPALEIDDLLIVREMDKYEVGDIVVYQSGSTLIVHRIIAKDAQTVVTQGDANNTADEPIALQAVKGKVVARFPGVGRAVNILKTPMGTLAVLIAAFALMELSFRKDKDKDEKALESIKEEIRQLKAELEGKE